jgi:predicted small metal-binding protein
MRAIECAVPGCQHLHADDDEALARLLLRHTRQTHPGVPMDERAADALAEASYNDKKHAKRKGFLETTADQAGRHPGGP